MKKMTMKKLITLLLAITAMMLFTATAAFAIENEGGEPAPDVVVMGVPSDDVESELQGTNLRSGEEPIYPDGLILDNPSITLTTGQTAQIIYRFTPEGQTLTMVVSFAADPVGIVSVDENGLVNGIKAGNTTITVTAVAQEDPNVVLTATCAVTVKDPPIDLSKVTMTLSNTKYTKTGKAIKPQPVLKYGSETLKAGTDYTLKYTNNVNVGTATVTAEFKEGRFKAGSKSLNFTIIPAKPAAAPISKIKSSKPNVVVSWKKVTCTGYQLQVSLNSDFKNAKKFTVKTNSKKVPKLKNNKKYFFRVRAYYNENSKTTYGAWSKSSSKVKTTGPVGDKYSRNGAYVKDETIKYDGNSYYYNKDGLKSGCSEKMWDKVKNSKSGTKYLIAVDCTKNRTCIYKGKKGNWKLKDYWKCTTGKSSTPTIKGKFKVCGKVSHFGEQKGYSVWYATRIKYEYYFHSILYKPWSKSSVLSGTLGKNKSHGCIRLKLKNAKWIYKNCKSGTKIVIY